MTTVDDLKPELSEMDLARRLQAIADDVQSKADRFKMIDPHDLLDLVELQEPQRGWHFYKDTPEIDLAEWISCNDEIERLADFLEGTVEPARVEGLRQRLFQVRPYTDDADLTFLTDEERQNIEEGLRKKELDEPCGGYVYARNARRTALNCGLRA